MSRARAATSQELEPPARLEIVPRISDVYAALPAITGKLELEYDGKPDCGVPSWCAVDRDGVA